MMEDRRQISRRSVLAGAASTAVATAFLSQSDVLATDVQFPVKSEFRIWDAHGHLSSDGATPSDRIDRILKYADRVGIERVIVFMGYPWSFEPSPDDLRRENDQVLEAIEHAAGRAFGFVYVNPKHTEASLSEMRRCVKDGPMVGIKLWVACRCHEACLDPIVTYATELKAPVLQHTWYKITGNLPGESTATDLALLAARHPNASFIAAHTGGDWERGIRAIRRHKNICSEICGGDPTAGFVEMAVRELGAERVIYGSDFAGRSFASQLAKVLGANVSDEAKQRILCGNIQRLLKPIFQEKGIRL